MLDLNVLVNNSLEKIEKEGHLQEIIDKRIEKTIKDIVDDVFGGYSSFGKGIKENIGAALNINLDRLGLAQYNKLVEEAVKEKLQEIITVQGFEKMGQAIEGMLLDVKKEYTLSEIIEKVKANNYSDKENEDKITLIIEDGSSYGYKHIYISEDENENKYKCDYQVHLDREGKPYSIKFKDQEINKNKILGGLYGTEAMLFKIYASGSKIVLDQGKDPEDYELYYGEED